MSLPRRTEVEVRKCTIDHLSRRSLRLSKEPGLKQWKSSSHTPSLGQDFGGSGLDRTQRKTNPNSTVTVRLVPILEDSEP